MPGKEWITLFEVNDRLEAEIIKEALEAQAIEAVYFQEGAVHYGYPISYGPLSTVEICVPSDQLQEAQAWLAAYQSGALENIETPDDDSNGE